eukprot:TRINITY_DN6044_c0_g1_i1.p1 TRINITY_DN6044_c0_g1~~TRINITY_DN6044_c0_g1_i1.p1  ORF type:complete len:210 (+),score=39.90 TRINITY_DN6044_c0_g1_i1:153-782(+)
MCIRDSINAEYGDSKTAMSSTKGGPAIAVLLGCSLLPLVIWRMMGCWDPLLTTKQGRTRRLLLTFYLTVAVTGCIFWVWALANCFLHSFDLGLVTFAAAVASAGWACRAVEGGTHLTPNQQLFVTVGGCLLVAVNYGVGIAIFISDVEDLMGIYCVLGWAAWTGAGITGYKLLRSHWRGLDDEGSYRTTGSAEGDGQALRAYESEDGDV